MQKQLLKPLAALLGMVLLSACGSSTAFDSSIRRISGTADNYSGPADQLGAYLYVDEPHLIATGSIGVNGAFSIELPESVPTPQLNPITDEFPPGPTISDLEAHIGVVDLGLSDSGSFSGFIALTSYSDEANANAPGAKRTRYVYSDRSVEITGSSDFDGSTYDVNLGTGWNLVTVEYFDPTGGTPSRFTSDPEDGLAWHYFSITP